MLYVCLTFSAVLLVGMIIAACVHRLAVNAAIVVCGVAGVFTIAFLPVVGWQAFGLVLAGLPGLLLDRRLLTIGLALLVTAGAYAVAFHRAYEHERAIKDRHPMESMNARLPRPPWNAMPMTPKAEVDLRAMEQEAAERASLEGFQDERFRWALELIHSETREAFVNSPGFGLTRMSPYSRLARSREPQTIPEAVPQPSAETESSWSPGSVGVPASEWFQPRLAEGLATSHRLLIGDFATPRDIVVVKNRRAWNFQPHELRKLLEVPSDPPLQLLRIDLVGLLLAEKPRVYLSEELPRMRDVRRVPTRDLDGFEQAGLQALVAGEMLFVREQQEDVRMLGAIRSAAHCVECHGGQRGDLLGAFSYRLRRK